MKWLALLSVVPSILVGLGAWVIWRGRVADPRAASIHRLKELSEREKARRERMEEKARASLADEEPWGDFPYSPAEKSDV